MKAMLYDGCCFFYVFRRLSFSASDLGEPFRALNALEVLGTLSEIWIIDQNEFCGNTYRTKAVAPLKSNLDIFLYSFRYCMIQTLYTLQYDL